MLLEVVNQNQAELIKYVKTTYDNVSLYAHQNWLRLDFNQDGSVDIDDIRKSMQQLYEFLKKFDYIQATQQIKSTVYNEARKYIKGEHQNAGVRVISDDIPIVEDSYVSQETAKSEVAEKIEKKEN